MEFCPNCGIGLSNAEKRIKFCENCRTDFEQDEEELECPNCENMTLFNVVKPIKNKL